MAVPQTFSAGAVVVQDTLLASPVGMAGLVSEEIDLGNVVRTTKAAGSVYERAAAVVSRSPTASFGTNQVKSLLGLTGGLGRCILNDATHPGVDLYLNKDACNGFDLTDSQRYRIGDGFLAPTSLSVSHREDAQMTAGVTAISVGGNEPIQVDPSIAFPTGLADTERFGLYQQTVGGINLEGCNSMQIDFGVSVRTESADGAVFPEFITVDDVVTRVTLGGINPRWLADSGIPIGGRKMTHADTTLRLVRYVTNEADAYMTLTAAEHITFTLHGIGTITSTSASDGGSAATCSLMLYAIHDGTNVPMIIDTAAALV